MKWSEWVFGPLFFFNFRYIKGGVMGNNNIDIKKCTTNFLWFWYFGEVGEIFKNFQKHPLERVFEKMVSNLSILEGIFEAKFQSWFFFKQNLEGFFFRKNFQRDLPCFFAKKLKGFFFRKILWRDVPVNLRQNFRVDFFFPKKSKGISLVELKVS